MRLLVLTILASLSACAAVDTPAACRITHLADIPIEMVGNFPFVDARINDRPAALLLDTGDEIATVLEASFDRLGLARDYRTSAYVTGVGGQSSVWPTHPVSLSLGPVALPPAVLLVSPMGLRIPGGHAFDGVIGGQVLSAYDVDLDIPARRLGLYERRQCPGGMTPIAGATNLVIAQANRADLLTVPIAVDGNPVTALVDTGATRSLVDARAAGLAGDDVTLDREVHINGIDPVGLGARAHRFEQVQVGSEVVTYPYMLVAAFGLPGINAVLGMDYWRDRRVWISYGSRTLTIGPPQHLSR